jgi:subtilisin family serine protease
MKQKFMKPGLKIFNGLIASAMVLAVSLHNPALAKSAATPVDTDGRQSYIVVLADLPLSTYDGRNMRTPERYTESSKLEATANHFTGASKLDVNSPRSRQYLKFLDERFTAFQGEATLKLGRELKIKHRYRIATNGFATALSASEAAEMVKMPGVVSVRVDEVQRLHTDSGPGWLGADILFAGDAGFPETGGEGVVVGIIDSGVNWFHPAFQDPGENSSNPDDWDHVNPYGEQLGLCSKETVLCNDKLVGVYDFVEDDNDTDVVEENTDGKDNAGHGSHVASTAVGNPDNVTLNGIPADISGVAPNANIVSYRVCYIGDAADPDDDGCNTSAILSALDQAVADQVDVINYSIGGSAYNPWNIGSTTYAFLNARAAGIFVATSTGNAGPNPGTIGAPANAPWIMAVGNATHDRVFASVLENLSGGNTAPPTNLVGASFTNGISVRNIVHAGDYGYPLCGIGDAQSQPDCAGNTGVSNPFEDGTFNGEIVVCDRGTYGRVEKGKNLLLAGAGGYVLANSSPDGDLTNIVADDHCLPATHLNYEDGEALRTWLASGADHQASISGFSIFHIDEAGDSISASSSRGPNLPPAENILKPDMIAPGTDILAASSEGSEFAFLSGTSMASPHVTGGAALIKSVHPDWTPSMIASTMAMTATPALALDYNGSTATPHKRGSGRPQLGQAVNAGVYLNETKNGFIQADPSIGGDPKNLNLPGLVNTVCRGTCDFQRTVTDLVGGASWTASARGFADDISVTITPSNFSLANGGQQALTIRIDLNQSDSVGRWVYGDVKLSSAGYADAVFPVAVFSDGGQLPSQWQVNTDSVSGWQEFALSDLAAMPDATFTSGGLVEPRLTTESLPQDPNWESASAPYTSSVGVMTVWHDVPADALWLHTETLASTAEDLDLYVGLDANNDGIAQESEELCSSTSPTEIELCDLFTPVAGRYWILVQNWSATLETDDATIRSYVVSKDSNSPLTATGSGIIPAQDAHIVRVSWDNVNEVPGTELVGAIGIGTSRETPNNVGIIPIVFNKTAIESPETLVLMNGIKRGFTLGANGIQDLAFIDVPPGTDVLNVAATGADEEQSENLILELYREDFDNAFANAPFASFPNTDGAPLASASGANGSGPELSISGSALIPGRWFVVLKNTRETSAAVDVQVDLDFSGTPIPLRGGLWEPGSRPGLKQGYDFNSTGDYRALLWYTYTEDGAPAWYLAAALEQAGNVWVAELRRFTNDGAVQQSTPVGFVSVTTLAEEDEIFSFVLFGQEGSDRMFPTSPPICPTENNVQKSYTGIWSRPVIGIGGATVLVNETSQGYVHYLYDSSGNPIWLNGADATDNLPNATEMALFQWEGYCAVCSGANPVPREVGIFTRDFADESTMSWNLDYALIPPLSGLINRTDETEKLTARLNCQ